ncbi:putative ribonuclease H-like domain-containing protein [Tanacetum coccineum]
MKSRFQMSSMGELTFFLGLQVKHKPDGIFISQDKYVAEILKKFNFASVKTASTPIETQKPLVKDEEASDVDVHLYRSMIGSLMYVTASRPDIMFAVCACSRFQVTPKISHLSAVKTIFRYLKGKPKLGLWYPRESSFDLESYSDSDYARANLDRKSTTGGCQFLGRRLITWQCKKQTIVATSTTEAEYVAAASCCGQVLWIQNQMLDYGFNFMNTKIYIDNESTICIVKNPVYHSKTKHIAIRHHFIRDAYEKKLIQGKNSLVKHFEDMRLCSPSKEFLQVLLVKGLSCLRESLRRIIDGAKALLILTLFIRSLDKVSTDSVKFSTAGQTLISLTDDLSIRSNMAALESCPKHNMIAYLEKTEGNIEFHEVIDFLRRSYIYHALTIDRSIWVRMGQVGVRGGWNWDNALISLTDDLSLLSNMAALESCPKHNMIAYLEKTEGNVEFHEVIDFLRRSYIYHALLLWDMKGKVTPLFDNMLVQSTQDKGASSERLSDEQQSPSPAPTSEIPNKSLPDSSSAQPSEVPFEQQPDPSPRPSPRPSPTPIVPDSIPEHTGENLGDHSSNDQSLSGNEDAMTLQNVYDLCISLCKQVSVQAKEIKLLKAKISKLKKKATPVIKHFKAYQKRISKEQRQQRKSLSKKKRVQQESVSKQGRKNAKGDGKAKENAQSKGRSKEMMNEDKENDEVSLSTEDEVSTAKEGVSTDFEKVSTDRPKLSTDDFKVSTDEQMESTDDQVDASEEIFKGSEDQGEGTEEKVESTTEQKEKSKKSGRAEERKQNCKRRSSKMKDSH